MESNLTLISNYNVATFQDYTGISLTEDDLLLWERAYRRAVLFLQSQLGWEFNYTSQYSELGISKRECDCVKDIENMQAAERQKYLNVPEIVQGHVKLFNYNLEDSQFFIDPALAIYSVKLVYPLKGYNSQYVTLKKLEYTMPRINSSQNIIRYIERCNSWPCNICGCNCAGCAILAVDATWLNEAPESMIFILSDLISYYMKHPYSNQIVRDIKSESVDGHSVSYGDEEGSLKSIQESPLYKNMISLYKGPYSPYSTKLRVN